MRHPLGCATWIGSLVMIVAVLAGCASAPQYRYYTIDMGKSAQIDAPVRVLGVNLRVNEALARPEILVRTSSTQIEYYALDRWASGLEEQIAEKLKTEFAGASADKPGCEISGRLMAFEQIDTAAGPEVRIKLDMEVDQRHAPPAAQDAVYWQRLYTVSRPMSSSGAAAAVEALSRATEEIAAQLAADLAQVVATSNQN